jgi:hypothetical protein
MPKNTDKTPTDHAQQNAAQASDAKAQPAATAKPSGELSETDLKAVAGGVRKSIR